VFGLDLDALMRATSACLAAVTFAGTAAAVRLLGDRPALRAGAVLAAAFTAVVLVFSGVLVLIPVVLGAAALGYALAGARRPRTPDAAAGVG
jgi:amino acid efflux transporter